MSQAILELDEAQISYYSRRIKDMPVPVLKRHGVLDREGDLVSLSVNHLSMDERYRILMLCEQKLREFMLENGSDVWSARYESDPVSLSTKRPPQRARSTAKPNAASSSPSPPGIRGMMSSRAWRWPLRRKMRRRMRTTRRKMGRREIWTIPTAVQNGHGLPSEETKRLPTSPITQPPHPPNWCRALSHHRQLA